MNKPLINSMILISLDALKADDIEFLKSLPNFSMLMNTGVVAERVKTIYPSLTYPAHTTIITGNYPKNHGIINNKLMDPHNKLCPWFWYRKHVKTQTLYDAAKENHLEVASIFWPVSAKSSIKYNMPEIFSYNKFITQEMSSLMSGSVSYQLKLFKKYRKMKNGIREPELDNFAISCTMDTLKNYRPDLLMLHLLDLDTQRHGYGTNSAEAFDALKRHDFRLGQIINTLKEMNSFEKTNIIVLGDHGFQDFEKVINLNIAFKDAELLAVDSENNLVKWKAYLKTCDGSAYVYLNNPLDGNLQRKVETLLNTLQKSPDNGIKTIYTTEQLTALGCDPKASFMLEAAPGYAFSENLRCSTLISTLPSIKTPCGTHGYSPDNPNLDTMFIAAGPAFNKGKTIKHMNLIDVAPTLSKVLNINFYPCDGKIIKELIK